MRKDHPFVIVKILKDNAVEQNLKKYPDAFKYFIADNDQPAVADFEIGCAVHVVFIVFEKKGAVYDACALHIAEGTFGLEGNRKFLICTLKEHTMSKLIIDNFTSSAGIDLKDDFEKGSYLITETAKMLYQKLLDSLRQSPLPQVPFHQAPDESHRLDPEGPLSQKNRHCVRAFELSPSNRSEFQRDRERVLHSKAFRRLVDKAQIFTATKGDHFRTRMTHTLEVSQIARGIARELGANEDLTEAIALAHDIGHTPFGHQGERTLQRLLNREVERLPEAMRANRRFKHNLQGVRVLSYLEEKYTAYDGLNLSYQVMEGVLKHTGTCPKGKKCPEGQCDHHCVDMEHFLVGGAPEHLYLTYKYPTTLEGQIVRIADEIAQRGHDLDDAFASKLLTYKSFEELCNIKKLSPLKALVEKANAKAAEEERFFVDKHNVIRAELVSSIIGFLIRDIVRSTQERIAAYDVTDRLYVEKGRIKTLLVDFSVDVQFIVQYLEKEISKKVINSREVANFDDLSARIIETLFDAYLKNPRLLPDSSLRRLFKEIKRLNGDVIDFRDSDLSVISKELDRIKNYRASEAPDEAYAYKFDALLRSILDHISGMTDNYAMNAYREWF